MIEVTQAELTEDEDIQYWACWLQITQDGESWMLPTTAPGTLENGELQAHFVAREDKLWVVAQEKRYAPDILKRVPVKQLIKAVALAMMDEFNVLRQEQGMPDLTEEEFLEAIKAKLR